MLSEVPGIGKKTAQRLLLELKDKISPLTEIDLTDPPVGNVTNHEQLVTALIGLGWSERESVQVADQILADPVLHTASLEILLKQALSALAPR